MDTAQKNFSKLVEWFFQSDDTAVAFSGGTKSALLVCAAQEAYGKNALILTANTAFFTKEELYRVHEVLDDYKIRDARATIYLLNNEAICANGENRCELCRTAIWSELYQVAHNMGAEALCAGSVAEEQNNACVMKETLIKFGIRSPFWELGFTRGDICDMLNAVGRGYYIRPQHQCLARQIAPEEEITAEKLDRIEEAEKYLRGIAGEQCKVFLTQGRFTVFLNKEMGKAQQNQILKRFHDLDAEDVCFITKPPYDDDK
ncbi:MAG: hypothetical protein VB082_01205 [Christensenella sp.]|nr:hypothetical protein [Christensenella sp.]